jgi:hypothetical protein
MGRIREPVLRELADQWAPIVQELLHEIGQRVWPPKKIKQSLFSKAEYIIRFSIEGPVEYGNRAAWALSHTSRPSAFDASGTLSEGEREFWLLTLENGSPPLFHLEGASIQERIPANRDQLLDALNSARKEGPKVEPYFGNKGPLSHKATLR